MSAKILYLDLETSPNLAHVWGLWQQNIAISQLEEHTHVICFGARWAGTRTVIFKSVHHDGRKAMLDELHRLMDEADIVVGWNSQAFDVKHIRRELLEAGYTPPSPWRDLDLMRVVKQQYKMPSNKLDYVAQLLGVGARTKHTGFQLWLDCMAGDEKAWKLMRRYQLQDVNLLVDLHDKLRPWITGTINLAAYTDHDSACRNCASVNVQSRGTRTVARGTHRRYQCQDCGTWMSGALIRRTALT